MPQERVKTRTSLDRSDWIHAALDVLADKGLDGLRVEVLAKAFGVTKGSFYWHFKDRQDLLSAVLTLWKEGRIKDIIKQTTAAPGRTLPQIYHVIEVYSAARSRKGMNIELAIRDWARRDPEAAAVVEEVDRWRLECASRLFIECGLPEKEAKSRSLLLYAYVFGQSLMVFDQYDADVPSLQSWIADVITLPTPPAFPAGNAVPATQS
ncbi:TetR/AcrR family transcriptional regulator [Oryzomicrobium sp.]|uniref:TetR/AcrR family transcriptional regulator n=1 Tax=Oryzomicrobium sp. TaxID=1911578 RepID=UPI0025D9353A|nr:TetR/AcrR family transcriptional regulator [Oryzomicrobium sp.]MCE1242459.1 TetR/AcrR family transcriptional regulator [Oryzomicrobium sp.]